MGKSTDSSSKKSKSKSKSKSSSSEKSDKSSSKKSKVVTPPTSSSESESEEESRKSSSSSEGESSESESEGSSSSESESASEREAGARIASPQRTTVQPSTSKPSSSKFIPPRDFKPIVTEPRENPFLKEKLRGKQLWLFSTPSAVPLSEVKSFTVDQIQSGKPIAEVKGQKYFLREEHAEEEAGTTLLLPGSDNRKYVDAGVQFTRIMRMEEYVELPSLPSEEVLSIKRVKAPITQPKGLKMRYKPFGAEDDFQGGFSDSDEVADVDMPDVGDRRTTSVLVNGHRKEKRRISDMDGGESRKKVRFEGDEGRKKSKDKERKKHKEKHKH